VERGKCCGCSDLLKEGRNSDEYLPVEKNRSPLPSSGVFPLGGETAGGGQRQNILFLPQCEEVLEEVL